MKTATQYQNKTPAEIAHQYKKGLRAKQGLLILILLLYVAEVQKGKLIINVHFVLTQRLCQSQGIGKLSGPHKAGCLINADSQGIPLSFMYLPQQAHHLNIGYRIACLVQNLIQGHKVPGNPNVDWKSDYNKNQQFE